MCIGVWWMWRCGSVPQYRLSFASMLVMWWGSITSYLGHIHLVETCLLVFITQSHFLSFCSLRHFTLTVIFHSLDIFAVTILIVCPPASDLATLHFLGIVRWQTVKSRPYSYTEQWNKWGARCNNDVTVKFEISCFCLLRVVEGCKSLVVMSAKSYSTI